MDDIDRKILKLLQANARMSLKTIAEKTFLSSPAVSARIEPVSYTHLRATPWRPEAAAVRPRPRLTGWA